ncbi:hypothetical protein ACFXCZ_03285, partial [Streptomyces sp. NPDC059396]
MTTPYTQAPQPDPWTHAPQTQPPHLTKHETNRTTAVPEPLAPLTVRPGPPEDTGRPEARRSTSTVGAGDGRARRGARAGWRGLSLVVFSPIAAVDGPRGVGGGADQLLV